MLNVYAIVDQCKGHVLTDMERLHKKKKELPSWTDTSLLRKLLILDEMQSWQVKDPSSTHKDGMAENKEAVQYLIWFFRAPLEF